MDDLKPILEAALKKIEDAKKEKRPLIRSKSGIMKKVQQPKSEK